jgi:SAM-dependent methyltransferase
VTSFDRYARTYEETVQRSIDFAGLGYDFFVQAKAIRLEQLARAQFGPSARPSLLDVGCGIGAIHPLLARTFGHISGVDSSPDAIERARRHNPTVRYSVNVGAELPFRSGAFDLVTAMCVLHHVPHEQWPCFLQELKRVTRTGGLVCLIEHNPLNPLTRLAVWRCPFDADARLFGARTARRLLSAAGLTHVRSEHFLLFPTLAPAVTAIERGLGALPLGAQYLAWGQSR